VQIVVEGQMNSSVKDPLTRCWINPGQSENVNEEKGNAQTIHSL
jgi:hypothetical protein